MNKKSSLSTLVGVCFGLFAGIATAAAPYTPPTVTVDYNGEKYTISSQRLNYTASPTTLTSQPWWGNSSLAYSLAGLVKLNAGEYLGPGSGLGALFGYGLSGGGVSIAYWFSPTSSTIDCASCPGVAQNYYYAYLISMTPDITLASLAPSLMSTATALDSTMANTDMLINGAHSRPMSRRVAVGEKTSWIAGDWGRDDHGSRDGSMGIAEIGVGYNFGPAQIDLSIGKNWADQHTVFGGNTNADGQYLMVEGIIPVSERHQVFATLSAYDQWGSVDIQRGYLNASGTQDASFANPDTQTWGLRARLDWENALAIKTVQLSPYAEVGYVHSRMDGYTETGGGLPAQFDSRSDHTTEVHAGVNAAMPLTATSLQLVANLEAAHRFNDTGAATSGDVTGLFTFSLPGQHYQSDWLKGGVGVEGMLGKGKASLMLNGTTRSSMPNAWLAASYQLAF